jgi:PAS domain S-box-containing protein
MNPPDDALLFLENSLFQNAFHHAAIGMALVGLKGEFLKVNQSLCQLVGYPEEELRAFTFQDITYAEDLESDLAQLARLIAGEIPDYRIEKRYITKAGALVWILLSVSLVRSPEGQPLFFISQIQDITTRKKAEKERDALFDLPLFLHAVMGFDGFVKRVNPIWVSTFGHPMEVWKATPYNDLVHPDDRTVAEEAMKDLAMKKELIRLNLRIRCADGNYLHTVWCARGEPESGVFYASGFDATPLIEVQENLHRTLVEKEGLLAELQRSHSEIMNLRSKLLTICAWTKRVRCKDRWMSVDEFLTVELGLNLTHGMSAEAEDEFMKGGLT